MAKLDFSNAKTTKNINRTIRKSNEKGNALATANIRLEDIDENPDNKLIFNMEDIEKLARTIEKDGFYGAIEVYDKGDGRYEISAGHRRFNAVKQLGWNTIPATITSMPGEIDRRLKLVKSNINHREMSPLDWAKAIFYTRETYYMKDAKEAGIEYIPPEERTTGYHARKIDVIGMLMEDFNMSKGQIQKYLALLAYPEELQQLIRDEKISMTALIPINGESFENKVEIAKELSQIYDNLVSADNDSDDYLLNRKHVESVLSKLNYKKIKESREKKEIIKEHLLEKDDYTDLPSSEDIQTDIIRPEIDYEESIEDEEDEEVNNANSFIAELPKEPIRMNIASPKPTILDNILHESYMKLKAVFESEYEIEDMKTAKNYIREIKEMLNQIDK